MKIVQFLGGSGSWGDVTPDTMQEKGLGGRETALLSLADSWARRGHEVINFVPVEQSYNNSYSGGGNLHIVPAAGAVDYLKTFGSDALVSWEEPRIFGVPGLREKVRVNVLEMQVASLMTSVDEEQNENIDTYAVLSEWAGDFLCDQEPHIDKSKLKVFPNGVDISRYSKPVFTGRKNKTPRFYYSSSPDRGLNHVLKMWPNIREIYPEATLHVCYGLDHWISAVMWSHNMQAQVALEVGRLIHQDGVKYHGRVGQLELAKIQESCDALLYPCDTIQPTETGCITVVEAGAACSPAIITDCDCLGSEFNNSSPMSILPFKEDVYLDLVKEIMEDNKAFIYYQEKGRELAESRNWLDISDRWLDYFERY